MAQRRKIQLLFGGEQAYLGMRVAQKSTTDTQEFRAVLRRCGERKEILGRREQHPSLSIISIFERYPHSLAHEEKIRVLKEGKQLFASMISGPQPSQAAEREDPRRKRIREALSDQLVRKVDEPRLDEAAQTREAATQTEIRCHFTVLAR